MRNSMAGKKYFIIGIMVLLALAIAGLGLYGSNSMASAMAQLGLQAKIEEGSNLVASLIAKISSATNDRRKASTR